MIRTGEQYRNGLQDGREIWIDGTPEAADRLARVLRNDPMMGIFRHADAGYADAQQCGRAQGVDIPMG